MGGAESFTMQFLGIEPIPLGWVMASAIFSRAVYLRSKPTDNHPFRSSAWLNAAAAVIAAVMTAPHTLQAAIIVGLGSAALVAAMVKKSGEAPGLKAAAVTTELPLHATHAGDVAEGENVTRIGGG